MFDSDCIPILFLIFLFKDSRDRRLECYFPRENEVWQRVESASFYLNDKVISSLHLQKKIENPKARTVKNTESN